MVNKNRTLFIFKYLWEHTDENYPATTKDIMGYLASLGIPTTRKTVAEDVCELQSAVWTWYATAAARTNTLSVPVIWSLRN